MPDLRQKILVLMLAATATACGGGGGGGSDSIDPTGTGGDPTTPPTDQPIERELQISQAELNESLHCTAFTNPDKPPVLLVHGTFVTGAEQYTFFYTPMLVDLGHDVCIVTYPDRGLGDMQLSAEYVVNALRVMHDATGRKVAMIGHSQGGLMPRWAIKYFPSARNALQEFVMLAAPNHGTTVALPGAIGESLLELLLLSQFPVGLLPEVLYQFPPGSNFIAALNGDDETPGDIDYSAIYTQFDELVQPVPPLAPTPTAALEFEQGNPSVSNILLQDVCPGHLADHVSIGTSDTLTFQLALDAINNPGPADVSRAGGPAALCALLPIDLENLIVPQAASDLLSVVESSANAGLLDPHLANDEPALMPYVEAQYRQAE